MSTYNKNKISINNIFLLCALFFIPIIVAYTACKNIINENYYAELQKIKDKLELQSSKVEKISSDKYQISDFIKTVVLKSKISSHSNDEIKSFLDKLEKKYPEAFRWQICDENGNLLNIKSKAILPGKKSWEEVTKFLVENINILSNPHNVFLDYKQDDVMNSAFANIQVIMGKRFKLEVLSNALERVEDFEWQGKNCYAVWAVEAKEYKEGYPNKIKGGALMLVFPDKLSPVIWKIRMIKQRKKGDEKLEFPIALLNLSDNYSEYTDEALPQSTEFSTSLIEAYKNRSTKFFMFKNMLGICAQTDLKSDYRIISLADLNQLNYNKRKYSLILNIIALLMLLLSIVLSFFVNKSIINNIGLRKRIIIIFSVSIIMPVISLISIGNAFTKHEETRLKNSTFTRMQQGMEALNLRYQDTPKLIEKDLFIALSELIGKPPYTNVSLKKAMSIAIKDKTISHYFITDKNGRIIDTNWGNLDKTMKRAIEITVEKSLFIEDYVDKRSNGLELYIDEEIEDMFKLLKIDMDFSRPSRLRYFAYSDRHLYMMRMHVKIGQDNCTLLVNVPERQIENIFAQNEFKLNRLTKATNEELDEHTLELSFFSSLNGEVSYPEESPIWHLLKEELNRSSYLNSEEKGEVTINNETFLYLIKPLTSMNEKSLIPCYLTSSRNIHQRIKDLKVFFISLSLIAILATFILSLFLTSSLLEPIKTIDSAAQLVGKGDLNVIVPEAGEDELGHLSKTFNNMLKGLREHQKMQAYVSDSVKEAIQEGDKETEELKNGKDIEATILFADIRNFTSITEKNSPDTVFELLNEFLGGVEPIIRMNHGRVDKYIGDAVMAVFHKSSPEHHAFSAVKTAVMMMKYVEKLNGEREKEGLFPISIGIGISTGTVLLGDVGSADRKDLTVIGDEVNLASRLETASKQGRHSKIIFSGSTYKFVQDKVKVELMPFNEIRGKEQTVSIYELIEFKG